MPNDAWEGGQSIHAQPVENPIEGVTIPVKRYWPLMLAIFLASMSISNTTYAGYDCLKSSTRSLVYTDVVEAHTTDGMITEVGYNSSTGTTLEIGYQQTWPTQGNKTTMGWQTVWGNTNYGTITIPYSAVIKTLLWWTKEHYTHEDYLQSAPEDRELRGTRPQYVCGTGQVLYEFDKVYVSSAPSYPLLIDYAVGGDNAPFSYLVTKVGTIDPTYGIIIEAQPNSRWGWTYSSGKSLGIAVDAFGFGLHGKMALSTGYSISHQFTTKYSRYIGYDRNTGQKMWYWTHN